MPYQIQWEKKGVRWKFFGKVTSKETLASNMEIYGNSKFDGIRYQIADFSDVTDFEFSSEDMKKIAYFDQAASKSNPRVKVALIAPTPKSKELLTQYAEYSGASASPWETRIFDSIREAEAWTKDV
ncbi:MAG: hypothetical protein MI748_11935 [Opitutales bacterium]|nr:hypothetical protein [Opitutales bacterium]